MRKLKKKWLLMVFPLSWIAWFVLLLHLTPVRPGTLDEVYVWWRYLRFAFQAFAITTVTAVLLLLVAYRRKLIGFLPSFRKYRPLLLLLIQHNFYAKYRRSVLGVVWTLLNPLANMVVLSIVFTTLLRRTMPYFPAFLLCGQVLYGCFSESTRSSLQSMVVKAKLLRKVYIPKYIIPLTNTITSFVGLLFSMGALLLVMAVIGAPFHITMLAAPAVIAYLFMFCLGMSLLLATAYVFFRDTAHLYSVLLTALQYLSAIFYDISMIPKQFAPIVALNPMFQYIRVFRNTMLYGTWPSPIDHLICGGIAITALCAGIFVFYRGQDQFILYV